MTIKQLLIGTAIATTAFGILWLRSPHEKAVDPSNGTKVALRHPTAKTIAAHRRARPWLPVKKARSSEAQLSSRKLYGK